MPFQLVSAVKAELERELDGGYMDLDSPHSTVYSNIPGVKISKITNFLKKSSLYSVEDCRWINLNTTRSSLERNIYSPLATIISDILTSFGIQYATIEETHGRFLVHKDDDLMILVDQDNREVPNSKSSPDLCLIGQGNKFRSPERGVEQSPSYFNCVAPIEVKTSAMLKKLTLHQVTLQVAVYARQCYTHQPNRRFLSAIIVTEEEFHLLVFDRVGVMRTAAFNIHEHAETFVRVVLGLSLFDDSYLTCFDKNIEHSTCVHEHLLMYLTGYTTPSGTSTPIYNIALNKKTFLRKAIRGRGTRCWLGTMVESSVKVIVKESYRSEGRDPESDILLLAAGVDGVGQMIAYREDNTDSVFALRKIIIANFTHSATGFDKYFSRIILEAYGRPIHYFDTQMQLLMALRDAVAGHRSMWLKGILHRDISLHNVLLGKENATVGNSGVLIDFDMAIKIMNYTKHSDARTGTRAFQSISVLSVVEWNEWSPPQDHLDDLESFFYVLMWICLLFVAPRKMTTVSKFKGEFEGPDSQALAATKNRVMKYGVHQMTPWFSTPVFKKLVMGLSQMFVEIVHNKSDKAFSEQQPPTIQEIHQEAQGKDHDTFLGFLDTAINELQSASNYDGGALADNQSSTSLYPHAIIDLDDDQLVRPPLPIVDDQATTNPDRGGAKKRARSHSNEDVAAKRAHTEVDEASSGITHLAIKSANSQDAAEKQ